MNTVLDEICTMSRTNAPSLVQLCIKTAIDNLSHIRDVGDPDINLLKEILNKCTPDQLLQIENASKDRDLSSVTAALWHQFYIQKFGVESASYLVRMKEQLDVPINWRQIYTDKSKEWTVMVSTNVTTVNRTATTPGFFKNSFDQIKQICETLVDQIKKVFETVVNQLKKLGGFTRHIYANAPAFDMFVTVSILLFAIFTSFVVIAFIGAQYIIAAIMLLLDIIPA